MSDLRLRALFALLATLLIFFVVLAALWLLVFAPVLLVLGCLFAMVFGAVFAATEISPRGDTDD
jgi:fatty acid desaturase